MKILWIILSVMPAAFLFHFYEYGQYSKHEEAPFLLAGSLVYIVVTGLVSRSARLRDILLLAVANGLFSILLGMYFIANESGWFKPIGRDGAIFLTVIGFTLGQLLVRVLAKQVFQKGD